MAKIIRLAENLPVDELRAALRANEYLWNQRRARTENPDSPHYELEDIWARYCPEGAGGDIPHRSVWYDNGNLMGPLERLVYPLMSMARGEELGAVLITRIPAGKTCKPHIDSAWHARFYDKFAIQIDADPGQAFCFEGESLVTKPGDLFWFDNSYTHWVTNPTDHDRVTLIVCIKTSTMDHIKT